MLEEKTNNPEENTIETLSPDAANEFFEKSSQLLAESEGGKEQAARNEAAGKPSDASDTLIVDDSGDAEPQDFFAGLDGDAEIDPLFDDANELPDFDFAEPPVVKLKDGSEFYFKIPDLQSEKRADQLRKTLIITSPAKVNGFNPTNETTDYATADVRYFIDNLVKFKGFALNAGGNPDEFIDAKTVVRTEKGTDGKTRTITAAHLVPVKHQRAAAARIYGGRIEVEKPDKDDKRVRVLNETRFVTVKQEFGVEQNDDGTFTRPTNVVRYVFREPTSKELTFWQTKCFLGYKIPIKGGGSREERYFNTEQVVKLFDLLIFEVRGASNVKDIPEGVKRTAVTIAMGEVSGDVGN